MKRLRTFGNLRPPALSLACRFGVLTTPAVGSTLASLLSVGTDELPLVRACREATERNSLMRVAALPLPMTCSAPDSPKESQ